MLDWFKNKAIPISKTLTTIISAESLKDKVKELEEKVYNLKVTLNNSVAFGHREFD
jgi:hypothetical protein